ncbi:MAG: phage/plasmid primase, P4 family, partial [Pseudomonadota bacterium]
WGDGSNGKSTFVETLRRVLGPYAMHTPSSSLLSQRFGGIRNDVARLAGARLVSAIEMGNGLKLDEPLIKQLTGGDQVTARFLYREHFEYRPEFKIVIVANHKPQIMGTDHGIWRRIHLIPFTVQIPESQMDKNFGDKLKDELPGILAWAVQGCLEWQENGLMVPEKVKIATARYREEMDRLRGFLEDSCLQGNDQRVPLGEAYKAYKEWADDACQDPVGKRTFGDLMRQRGFTQVKSNGIRFWTGIGLNEKDHRGSDKTA